MDWVHYLNDPPTTEWGRLRASNGHPEPYGVRLLPDRQRAHEQRLHAGEVRRDRQRLRQPVAGHRSQGANRGVRTEALQRHGLEREGHRPRRRELRRPRSSQLRVRARELRDRAAAHPRLPLEAAGLRPRFGAPADRDRRARVEPLSAPTIGGPDCMRPAA